MDDRTELTAGDEAIAERRVWSAPLMKELVVKLDTMAGTIGTADTTNSGSVA